MADSEFDSIMPVSSGITRLLVPDSERFDITQSLSVLFHFDGQNPKEVAHAAHSTAPADGGASALQSSSAPWRFFRSFSKLKK